MDYILEMFLEKWLETIYDYNAVAFKFDLWTQFHP